MPPHFRQYDITKKLNLHFKEHHPFLFVNGIFLIWSFLDNFSHLHPGASPSYTSQNASMKGGASCNCSGVEDMNVYEKCGDPVPISGSVPVFTACTVTRSVKSPTEVMSPELNLVSFLF